MNGQDAKEEVRRDEEGEEEDPDGAPAGTLPP
jgi:hypothetical protein